jgi:glycerol-3-phosphate dehydrogenase
MLEQNKPLDLFVIGGGINGCGIARDAAGRGYTVALAEMNDLASATSSASTKLFHGGLRYLEFFEFRLVREALIEREVLLRAMPHISWPMRFVLPFHKEMRFEADTPTSKLLSFFLPWMKGRRPAWLIRIGLFLYDNLGGREILPGTRTLDLKSNPEGKPLVPKLEKAFEYSDCWIEDSRLVVLNARDAQKKGASINVNTKVISAEFKNDMWYVVTKSAKGLESTTTAKMIVNAGGPWVEEIIRNTVRLNSTEGIRLVRGSHIVTKKLYEHEKCYIFQGEDGRIIFSIPYEEDFTLIGTTDANHEASSVKPVCTPEESNYLIDFANKYFKKSISQNDVVWTYSGVRPLYNDGTSSATAATRDYVLKVNQSAGGPVLNIFGGKITTYRRLAEAALDLIDTQFDQKTSKWTAKASMPGGDFPVYGVSELRKALSKTLPFLSSQTIKRLIRQYGTESQSIFAGCQTSKDLGQNFGNEIFQRELDWAIANEWVSCADDFLWRRSKLGLRVDSKEKSKIEHYILNITR